VVLPFDPATGGIMPAAGAGGVTVVAGAGAVAAGGWAAGAAARTGGLGM
jgi:hypothetical protein